MSISDFELAVCKSMSESQWTAHAIALLQAQGWTVAHFRPAMTKRGRWVTPVQGDGAGFPDLLCVRSQVGSAEPSARLLAIELKAERGRMTDGQRLWLDLLGAVPGGEAYCLRPSERERLLEIAEEDRR